jgi:peptidoglycan hydrolase-like protein with peptidoglycan-binding domain
MVAAVAAPLVVLGRPADVQSPPAVTAVAPALALTGSEQAPAAAVTAGTTGPAAPAAPVQAAPQPAAAVAAGIRAPASALTEGAADDVALVGPSSVDLRTGCAPLLQQGATGGCVAELQRLLDSHGAGLAVDGDFGPATEAATRDFQSAHGLAADGIAGPNTKAALYAASVSGGRPAPAPQVDLRTACGLLQRGSSGSCVSTLQGLLNGRGAGLAVDGLFGPATDGAVRSFQAANGLAVDGIVGPATKDALYGQASPPPPVTGGGGDAVVAAARVAVQRHIPYSWAGGHFGPPGPSHGSCVGYHGPIHPCPAERTVGLDCSGLARWAYWVGRHIDLDGNTDSQYRNRRAAHISMAAARPGDLVFFGTPSNTHHVAIFSGYRGGTAMMVEEPGTGLFAREVPVRPGGLWVHIS